VYIEALDEEGLNEYPQQQAVRRIDQPQKYYDPEIADLPEPLRAEMQKLVD